MEAKTVLITGIGGNVGQGIIRNIQTLNYPIRIIGTNIVGMSAGNHLVDKFYQVPMGFDETYIPIIKNIVINEKVDLIIPSTDFESYQFSKNQDQFKCQIACSGVNSTEMYLDKYFTSILHKNKGIPFAESCLPSEYFGQFKIAIAKPRKGRGSKGIKRNVTDMTGLADDEYLIQEQLLGKEITTAVYRKYKDGSLHGLISMERSLDNGATNYCKVVPDYDLKLEKIALGMIEDSDLKGSFNIQSIVTEKGEIIPFEINCRISGTNSIRSKFGFNDVQYTIEELLWAKELFPVQIKHGEAYRYLSDVIYLYQNAIRDINGNNSDTFLIF